MSEILLSFGNLGEATERERGAWDGTTPLGGRRPSVTVVLHPFLMLDDAWWNGARKTLRLIKELSG